MCQTENTTYLTPGYTYLINYDYYFLITWGIIIIYAHALVNHTIFIMIVKLSTCNKI